MHEREMKIDLKNELLALKEMNVALPGLVATHRRRFTTLNTTAGPVTGTDDMTHAWDGWIFVILIVCAVWPVIRALGSFS